MQICVLWASAWWSKQKGTGGCSPQQQQGCLKLWAFSHQLSLWLTLGLGFNIVGGTDQQYVSNDSSIYVSRIKKDGAAYLDGRLQEGDKIVAVSPSSCHPVWSWSAVFKWCDMRCRFAIRVHREGCDECNCLMLSYGGALLGIWGELWAPGRWVPLLMGPSLLSSPFVLRSASWCSTCIPSWLASLRFSNSSGLLLLPVDHHLPTCKYRNWSSTSKLPFFDW